MGLILLFPHPEAPWSEAVKAAQEAVGELGNGGHDYLPHVTLLYMGDARQGSTVDEIVTAAKEAAKGVSPITMKAEEIGFFPPSDSSGGETPVIVKYANPEELETLQVRFLRALAPHVHVKQFLDYVPHATLGYYAGRLPAAKRLALSKLSPEVPEWTADTVLLMDGNTTLARIKLRASKNEKNMDSDGEPGYRAKGVGVGDPFVPCVLQFDPFGVFPMGAREEVYQRAIEFHALGSDVDATEIT